MRGNQVFAGTLFSWLIFGFIGIGMWGCPRYRVWQQEMEGKAELKRAEQNRQIKTLEAKAKLEAAHFEMEADILRAKGAAQSNVIIDSSLTEQYLRYIWIQGLQDGSSEVIYIPTEANLPILESTRNLTRKLEK